MFALRKTASQFTTSELVLAGIGQQLHGRRFVRVFPLVAINRFGLVLNLSVSRGDGITMPIGMKCAVSPPRGQTWGNSFINDDAVIVKKENGCV